MNAADAWNALDACTYGFTLQKLNFPLGPAEYGLHHLELGSSSSSMGSSGCAERADKEACMST